MHRIITTLCICGAASVLAACGSSDSALRRPSAPETAQPGQPAADAQSQATAQAARQTQWERILEEPGVPHVDYDPSQITLSYFADASLPKGNSAAAPSLDLRAADQPNPVLRQDRRHEELTDTIAAAYGLKIRQQVYTDYVRIASFELPQDANGDALLSQLRHDFSEAVEYATFSRLYQLTWLPNDPDYLDSNTTYGPQWGHRRIGCTDAWDYSRGDPAVRVAVVDTGVRISHQELSAQVLNPQTAFPEHDLDVVNGDNTVEDTHGHGTFIAGLVAAEGDNGRTILGVAHQCEVVPIKISNGGVAADSDLITGCMLAVNLGANVKVINVSWGDEHHSPWVENMVNEVHAAGVLFVAAAGNDSVTSPHYPAAYTLAFCVGATNPSDERSSFSNYGDYVDIAAPGQWLKSAKPDGDASYNDWTNSGFGTSYAAPFVAAGAALLLSADPSLSNNEVRALLENTGRPTTGFDLSNPVLRLDLAAAFSQLGGLRIRLPELEQLVYHGPVTLEPQISGEPDRVDVYLNGSLAATATAEPWSFVLDTSSIYFGLANVLFVARRGGDSASASLPLLVDNSSGSYPVVDDFEPGSRSFYGLDAKGYALPVLEAIKAYPGPGFWWTQDQVAGAGPATWGSSLSAAYQGLFGQRFGGQDNSYGSHEIDALVSKRINLASVSNPTLVFYHRYNIEDAGEAYDRGWIYASEDWGKTFSPAGLKGGGEAYFTGYQAGWQRGEIDLSAFAGKQVHLALVFESDSQGSGEDPGEPAGWWVDKLTVADSYNEDVPSIGGVSVDPFSAYGQVPEIGDMSVTISQPNRVDRVRYILDCVPLGTLDFWDVVLNVDASPYHGVLDVPGQPNQLANLRVQYFDSSNNPGPEVIVPVYIFNLPGDTNADNIVDQADLDGFPGMLGLAAEDEDYVVLYDTDLDGLITEADAAAVGYYWGESI